MPDTLTAQVDRGGDGRAITSALFVVLDPEHPGPGTRHLLRDVERVAIGRGAARSASRSGRLLRIELDDKRVSTEHAELGRVLDAWQIRDLGSKNGLSVNGQRVRSALLVDGDWIELGQTLLRFRTLEAPADLPVDAVATAGGTLVLEVERFDKRLADVAASPVSVLLLGESGVGKEVAARALHAKSKRSGPFIPVNCAGLVESLAASTLFGHRKGAFTGATEDRQGAFRAAHGGTLLLDELADLPAATQGALLRTLQEREVVPVGDTRAHPVDVRIVAATLKDLDREVTEGRFRIDLLARINGVRLTIPPLRERPEDLGALVAACLERHAPDRRVRLAAPAAAALVRHAWPLNIRELDQALAAALALATDKIELEHLPEALAARPAASPATPSLTPTPSRKDELLALLRTHDGNLAAVARALGTSRAQVHRLLKRFDLDPAAYR